MKSFPASITASRSLPMLACAAWYGALVGLGWVVGIREHKEAFMAVGVVSALLTSFVMVRLGANRAGAVVVTPEAIALGRRSISRAGLRVSVASWLQPHVWTLIGTALELEGEGDTLSIGGTGHLPPRRGLPSVTRVDASVAAVDFAALARELGVETDIRAKPASDGIELDLVPSRTGIAGAWRSMAPWFATMGVAGAIGVAGSALGFEQDRSGMVALGALSLVVVVVGLVYTIRKSSKPPQVRHRLLVTRGSVYLVNGREEARALAARDAPDRITRVTYRFQTRGGTFEFPALRLDWVSGRSIVVGVWDTTKNWATPAERSRRLHYLVGSEEWRLLVDALGIH